MKKVIATPACVMLESLKHYEDYKNDITLHFGLDMDLWMAWTPKLLQTNGSKFRPLVV